MVDVTCIIFQKTKIDFIDIEKSRTKPSKKILIFYAWKYFAPGFARIRCLCRYWWMCPQRGIVIHMSKKFFLSKCEWRIWVQMHTWISKRRRFVFRWSEHSLEHIVSCSPRHFKHKWHCLNPAIVVWSKIGGNNRRL